MASHSPSTSSLSHAATIGGYRVGQLIGRGPLGRLFVGYDLGNSNRVALRLYSKPQSIDSEAWQQAIARYAELLVRHQRIQNHPAIQKVLRYGVESDTLFIATEYFEGRSIREILDEDGTPDPDWTVRVFHSVASALDHAAQGGMPHIDLNPFNILATRPDDGVRVINFGLGYSRNRSGSPYQAPELLSGGVPKTRFDIFAVGCVLVETLTGHPPFLGSGPAQTVEKLKSGELPDLSGLSEALQSAVLQMLEKDPAKRARSAVEVIDRVVRGQYL